MKLRAKVRYVSSPLDIKKRDWETATKQILCVEEINDEKENPEKIAIDFMGDKCLQISDVSEGDVVDVSFTMVYNRYDDPATGKENIFNSIRWWRCEKLWANKPSDLPF